jgi:Ser-tRNA(Ala) deacylase AlaX
MPRSNNQRKKELRQLHTARRLTYVEERKVWEVHVNGKRILLTTATVDGFLMAAQALAQDEDEEERLGA